MPIQQRNLSPNQESINGPLDLAFRTRVKRVRSEQRLTLADIGRAFGISGPFASNLLRDKHPASVRSIHIPRFVKALEQLEVEAGFREPAAREEKPAEDQADNSEVSLVKLIEFAHAKGFAVTFTPLSRD